MFLRDDIEDVLTKRYPIYKNTVSERNREIDNKFLTENEWYEKYNDLTNYKRKWYNIIVEEKIKEFNLNPIYVTAISMTYGFDTGVPVTLEEVGAELNLLRLQARAVFKVGMRILFDQGVFLKETKTMHGEAYRRFTFLKDGKLMDIWELDTTKLEEKE